MMKRRIFLLGAAGIATVFGWRFARATDEEAIVAVVYKRLGYLPLDAAGVHRFARDFAERHLVSSNKLRTVAAMGPLFRRLSFIEKTPLTRGIDFAEERMTTTYLLSTDFFANGADINRPVLYQGYYDAMRACSNPFRRLVNPPADA